MRFLSLFSGIEAASVAWNPLGWTCAAFSEIEPFPCAVLKHHYPDVPNLGDITKITQEQIESLGHIDVVVGGFPCQDLSVAGKRKGLTDESTGAATRSGLFWHAVRIAEWSRARFTVLENVPGLFSSHAGRDFACVAGALAGVEIDVPPDGWKNAGCCLGPKGLVEWAVLDAQYFGVPQRRRRVFLVLDTGDWLHRPPLLFESESLRGDSPPSRQAGQRVAPYVGGGPPFSSTGNERVEAEAVVVAKSLKSSDGGVDREDGHTLVPDVSRPLGAAGNGKQGWRDDLDHGAYIPSVVGALNHSGGHAYPGTAAQDADQGFLLPMVAGALQERDAKGPDSDTKPGHLIVQGGVFDQPAHSLRADGFDASEDGTGHGVPLAVDMYNQDTNEGVFPGLTSHEGSPHKVGVMGLNWQKTSMGPTPDMGPTLDKSTTPAASTRSGVRRLTPGECESLQGFPQGYTLIPMTKKIKVHYILNRTKERLAERCSDPACEVCAKEQARWAKEPVRFSVDGPRHKALGNSMATPVMAWIGRQIDRVASWKNLPDAPGA